MARDKGLPEDIYDAIVARLIERMPTLCREETTYFAINPDSLANNPGDLTFVVAPMSGNAPEGYQTGGGEQQVTINGGVIVKIHSPLQVDQAPRDAKRMADRGRGLWRVSRHVLAALVNWDPMKGDNEICRDPLSFLGFNIGKGRKKRSLGSMELHFAVNFDWDITNNEADL